MTDDLPDDLPGRLRHLQAPPSLGLPPPARLASLARQRRRRVRTAGAAGALSVLAVGGVTVPSLLRAQQPEALRLAQELELDGQQPLACGIGPLSAFTAEPGAEAADTPEAAALRSVLAEGIAGMSFPPEGGYVELAREPDRVTYGRREGDVGIGAVVSVARTEGGWGFAGSGGCGPLAWPGGRTATNLGSYVERDGGIAVAWTGDSCVDGVPHVRVQETDRVVSVLLVPPSDAGTGGCLGPGFQEQTLVPLDAPVGDRRVENVGYLPAQVVQSRDAAEAAQQAQDTARQRAHERCERDATALGGTAAVSYPVDVALVRADVPQVAEAWAALAGDAPAASCYLDRPDGTVWAYVSADGADPVVTERDRERGGLYQRLPSDTGQFG